MKDYSDAIPLSAWIVLLYCFYFLSVHRTDFISCNPGYSCQIFENICMTLLMNASVAYVCHLKFKKNDGEM